MKQFFLVVGLSITLFSCQNKKGLKEENASIDKASIVNENNTDCDKFLEAYEAYVMEYIAMCKKMKDDPANASYITSLSDLSAKANAMKGDINQCKNDAQVAQRILELELKMATAMSN